MAEVHPLRRDAGQPRAAGGILRRVFGARRRRRGTFSMCVCCRRHQRAKGWPLSSKRNELYRPLYVCAPFLRHLGQTQPDRISATPLTWLAGGHKHTFLFCAQRQRPTSNALRLSFKGDWGDCCCRLTTLRLCCRLNSFSFVGRDFHRSISPCAHRFPARRRCWRTVGSITGHGGQSIRTIVDASHSSMSASHQKHEWCIFVRISCKW